MSATYALTMDVGGSHVTAALVDVAARTVLRRARRDVPHTAPLGQLLGGWMAAGLEALGDSTGPVGHIGIAVPSPFDHLAGVSGMEHKFSALLGRPLRLELTLKLAGTPLEGVPIRFGNDADLFALGEWWAGAGRGSGRMIGLTLGTGLGSGFIDHGRVVTSGPEVPPGGELWSVPFRGERSETFACGAALPRLSLARGGEALTAHQLAQRAGTGDLAALEVFQKFGMDLAEVLAPWMDRFQAERVVLGGNVSRAFDLFAPSLRASLGGGEVMVSEHFETAGLLGAAAL